MSPRDGTGYSIEAQGNLLFFGAFLYDASALLWRLTLAGADVGTRWSALAERWAPFAGDGHYAFSDWHAAMAFVGAGREDLLQTLLQAQADAMTRSDDNAAFTSEVGFAATRAFIAYGQQDWARAVALLRKAGYERAHALAGGLAAWREANLPVEKSAA